MGIYRCRDFMEYQLGERTLNTPLSLQIQRICHRNIRQQPIDSSHYPFIIHGFYDRAVHYWCYSLLRYKMHRSSGSFFDVHIAFSSKLNDVKLACTFLNKNTHKMVWVRASQSTGTGAENFALTVDVPARPLFSVSLCRQRHVVGLIPDPRNSTGLL